jgi:ubiquitin-activating enzyme E1
MLHIAQEINSEYNIVESIEESIIQPFSQQAKSVISTMAEVYGEIIGQEVLKAVSSKFKPIFQFWLLMQLKLFQLQLTFL